tara:strand:+ start:435 stop:1412 length:978 start_codon:yes stop_codon:yes gene_type:complete
MAVTASGEIKISDILTEVGLSTTLANTSLGNLEGGSVFTINTSSAAKPNGSTPNSLSEWYSYEHASVTNDYFQLSAGNDDANRGGPTGGFVFPINGTVDMSFSGWWKFDGTHTGTTTAKQLMGIGTDGSNQIFFQNRGAEIRFRLRWLGSFHQAFYELKNNSANNTIVGLGTNGAINASNRGNVNAAGYVHLAFTYDASQASVVNGLKVYWNGSELTQTSNQTSQTVATRNSRGYNAATITLGGITSNSTATNAHKGGIDNVAVYNSLLSSGNVSTLYNSGTSISAPDAGVTSGLVGNWDNETDALDTLGNWDTSYDNGAVRSAY